MRPGSFGRIQVRDDFTSQHCEFDDENWQEDKHPHATLSLSFPLTSFQRYELSEDTLAQICEADNSA